MTSGLGGGQQRRRLVALRFAGLDADEIATQLDMAPGDVTNELAAADEYVAHQVGDGFRTIDEIVSAVQLYAVLEESLMQQLLRSEADPAARVRDNLKAIEVVKSMREARLSALIRVGRLIRLMASESDKATKESDNWRNRPEVLRWLAEARNEEEKQRMLAAIEEFFKGGSAATSRAGDGEPHETEEWL